MTLKEAIDRKLIHNVTIEDVIKENKELHDQLTALDWIILKLFMQVEEPDLTREELAYAESLVFRNGKNLLP